MRQLLLERELTRQSAVCIIILRITDWGKRMLTYTQITAEDKIKTITICRNALCCLKLKDRERDIAGDRPFDQSLNETED